MVREARGWIAAVADADEQVQGLGFSGLRFDESGFGKNGFEPLPPYDDPGGDGNLRSRL
jgi:hypothetical protein